MRGGGALVGGADPRSETRAARAGLRCASVCPALAYHKRRSLRHLLRSPPSITPFSLRAPSIFPGAPSWGTCPPGPKSASLWNEGARAECAGLN